MVSNIAVVVSCIATALVTFGAVSITRSKHAIVLVQSMEAESKAADGDQLGERKPQATPEGWGLSNELYEGVTHPRDVFLWYTKTPKTSSTVASTLIARAYERASLNVINKRYEFLNSAPAAYAAVAHEPYSDKMLKELRDTVQRPVLVVVSTRDGEDWIKSDIFAAQRLSRRGTKDDINGCEDLRPSDHPCRKYSNFAPNNSSMVAPFWVIRHENVVEDTCQLLQTLGLECSPELAVGQRSREDLDDDILNCPVDIDKTEVKCINDLNKFLWKAAPSGFRPKE